MLIFNLGWGEIVEIKNEKISYSKKVEMISPSDREYVRSELDWLAEWMRKHYLDMNYDDIRRFISEMVTVSI